MAVRCAIAANAFYQVVPHVDVIAGPALNADLVIAQRALPYPEPAGSVAQPAVAANADFVAVYGGARYRKVGS